MKKLLIGALVIVGTLFLVGTAAFIFLEREMRSLADTEIPVLSLAGVFDGTYEGYWSNRVIAVEVLVFVEEEEIVAIEIVRHRHGQGEAAETITDDVIASQSLEVDAVSGATYSSKAILLAIADALE